LKFELTLKAADEGEITTVTSGNVEETTGIFSSEDMKNVFTAVKKITQILFIHFSYVALLFFSLCIYNKGSMQKMRIKLQMKYIG
jgi:hypothetical protein